MAKRKDLEYKVATLSKLMDVVLEINYAACYGGYCIEINNGSSRLCQRMTSGKFDAWLDGAIAALDFMERVKEGGEINAMR